MNKHSIAEARARFPKLVRDAESGAAVELSRRGKVVAVLLGSKDYERLVSGRPTFGEAYAAFVRETGLRRLAIDPREVFQGVRDRSLGRVVGV